MEDSTHSLAHRYGCNFRILGLAQVVMSNGDLKPPLVDPISSSQWATVCAGFWNAELNEKDCICCMHRWLGGGKMMEHLAVIESQSFVPSRVYSDVT